MAINWTNNQNDDLQSTTVITAKVKGNQGSGTTLVVDNFTQYDVDGALADEGGLNWAAGDEFTITNSPDDDATLYTVVSLSGMGLAGVNKEWTITHTPTLAKQADNNGTVTKEGSYKGNHRSAENHLRKRNMGLI